MNHGTLTAYRHGCRCEQCSTTCHRYEKRLRVDNARHGSRRVPALAAREHLQSLLDSGCSIRSLADQLGYEHTSSVYQLMKRTKIRKSTMNRVLAVKPETPQLEWRLMSATGSERRIKALMYMGWQLVDIQRSTGIDGTVLSDILRGVSDQVRQQTHVRLRDFYDSHCMKDGGSVRSKLRAQREGWMSPLAWDDIDRDAKPMGVRR